MLEINCSLAKKLIKEQFPKWTDLPIYPVKESGNDNRTFRLGEKMSIRLPSAERYVAQVDKENKWLPYLADNLQIPIAQPIAKGIPSQDYPWSWSIMKWIEGETVSKSRIKNLSRFALELAGFIKALHSIDTLDGPIAGEHNFHRGGSLKVYDEETRKTIELLKDEFDSSTLLKIWGKALKTEWTEKPVWVHGDLEADNILVDKDGALCGVIDFGILGVGDPASDLVIAWTFFDKESRNTFQESINLDKNLWERARGWALWKALISYEKYRKNNPEDASEIEGIINSIVEEFAS
ncbi:MAG: aminoglycoside phosphotransferase family protein [Brevefilum sp.]